MIGAVGNDRHDCLIHVRVFVFAFVGDAAAAPELAKRLVKGVPEVRRETVIQHRIDARGSEGAAHADHFRFPVNLADYADTEDVDHDENLDREPADGA